MDASKVTAAKPKISGAVARAAVGTALPTNATADLNEAFKQMGYVTEDGIVNSSSPESTEIKAWGGDVVLTPYTGRTDTFSLSLMEVLSAETAKAVYGEKNVNVATGGAITIKVNSEETEESSWVFDMVMTGGVLKRIVIPRGKITETGDITYKDNEAVVYNVTIKAMPDASGNTHYEYIQAAA